MRTLTLALVALVALGSLPVAEAAQDLNRIAAIFHTPDSFTLDVEILFTFADAADYRRRLDRDANGEITRAELDEARAEFVRPSGEWRDPVVVDGTAATSIQGTDLTFRDVLGETSRTDGFVQTSRYESRHPAGAGPGRTITFAAGVDPLAVYLELPEGYAWIEWSGLSSSVRTSDGGRTLAGPHRLGEPFSARFGPAAGASDSSGSAGSSGSSGSPGSDAGSASGSGSGSMDSGSAGGADAGAGSDPMAWPHADDGVASSGDAGATDAGSAGSAGGAGSAGAAGEGTSGDAGAYPGGEVGGAVESGGAPLGTDAPTAGAADAKGEPKSGAKTPFAPVALALAALALVALARRR